jgi:HlyD family secretion protein
VVRKKLFSEDVRPVTICRPGKTRTVTLLVLVTVLAATMPVIATLRNPTSSLDELFTATVQRLDVDEEVVAPGRIASTQSTEIRCTLEKLDSGATGGSLVNGASTILALVPEGSMVKKGDILCELDSSAYQELVRRQKITLEQVKADHQQASLALDVAKLALEAYLEGERIQVGQDYKGQIALATADLSRQTDRLEWVRRMLDKGYSSAAQVASERQSEMRLTLSLRSMERALANYQRFSEPKEVLSLRSQVVGAQATLGYQTTRLNREQDRLEHYEKLLNSCTIRAPHDGYVVYANRRGRDPEVYEGAAVRERMKLFTLPDQSKMQAEVILHETVVNRVKIGMEARVVIEALPGRVVEGSVDTISTMPLSDQRSETANGIAYFVGRIKLRNLPRELRPDMSAEITILRGHRQNVLTVPSRAVKLEDGRNVCYVKQEDRLERRPVQVRHATHDLQEVLEGLTQGEEVVIDPSAIRPL